MFYSISLGLIDTRGASIRIRVMSSPYGAWRTHSFDTPHVQYDSSGWVISPTQRPPPDNTQHNRQTSMALEGFEPTIPASERPQTYALDRAAIGIGPLFYTLCSYRPPSLNSFPLDLFYPVLYSRELKCHSVLLCPTASYYCLFLFFAFYPAVSQSVLFLSRYRIAWLKFFTVILSHSGKSRFAFQIRPRPVHSVSFSSLIIP